MNRWRTRLDWILLIIGHSSTAPLWIRPTAPASGKAIPIAEFNDVAQKAGLTVTNVFGEKHSTVYILESTGTGVASSTTITMVARYFPREWNNVRRLGFNRAHKPPLSYNHDGTFSDVTEKAGLLGTGWGQGMRRDMTTMVGKIFTSPITERIVCTTIWSKFEEVAEKAGVAGDGNPGAAVAPSWITTCTPLDLVVANYAVFDLASLAPRGNTRPCLGRALLFCGPRGLASQQEHSLPQPG